MQFCLLLLLFYSFCLSTIRRPVGVRVHVWLFAPRQLLAVSQQLLINSGNGPYNTTFVMSLVRNPPMRCTLIASVRHPVSPLPVSHRQPLRANICLQQLQRIQQYERWPLQQWTEYGVVFVVVILSCTMFPDTVSAYIFDFGRKLIPNYTPQKFE